MGKQIIAEAFQAKKEANKNIFVPYIMAGDGGLEQLEERINFLESCGVAAIELGIPFSDPVADGPTIQDAGERALARGVTLSSVLKFLEKTKENRSVPVILMTYMNPIYKYGIDSFARDAHNAGVAGVIIPDIPLEEEDMVAPSLAENRIAFIRLASMTSPKERLIEIAKRTEGFLYAVAVTGTTGARAAHQDDVYDYLKLLKEYASVPVLAGFGVSNPEQAKQLSESCDGVIVGSTIVDLLHNEKIEDIRKLIENSL